MIIFQNGPDRSIGSGRVGSCSALLVLELDLSFSEFPYFASSAARLAMSLARVSSPSLFSHLSSSSSSHLLLPHALIPFSSPPPPRLSDRSLLPISASFSSQTCDPSMDTEAPNPYKWKPMCLYHTQGKCTKVSSCSNCSSFFCM